MVKKFKKCGLEASQMDPCLFARKKYIVVIYVDNILFWSR